MTTRVYMRAVVPIGIFFSLSLICGNVTYLYLSVAFIQMLKATTPVATLISGWILGLSAPNLKQFLNVSAIVVGVIIASMGEIHFVTIGVIYQMGGIVFEALRLTMVQRLLSSSDFKMDPLVSLYYFAPICAVMNGVVALIWEVPRCSMEDVYNVGLFTFFLNGLCAFLLNVSVVFLVSSHSIWNIKKDANILSLDWQDFGCRSYPLRCTQGYPARRRLDDDLGYSGDRLAVLRILHCSWRHGLLQARLRAAEGLHC